MLRKKWIFWTATALLALVITSLWVWQQDLITKNATVQFGEESVRTIDLPFVASTEDRWVTIEFDVQILPLGSKRFVVYADDCLRNLQINGTHLPIENNCNRKDQEMDLSAYLHTGENRVHALIEDFGGIVEFSFTQKISYVPYALLNIILIVTLYVYSIYYFRTRHDKK